MNKIARTPGPWNVGKGIAFCTSIYAGRVNLAFARQDNGHIDAPTAEANAAHIVACVNACEGINPNAVPDLLSIADRILERGYVSACIDEERDDHAALAAAIAKARGQS